MSAEQGDALRSGLFITVEGGDGAGKTTLARQLTTKLRSQLEPGGDRIRLTAEPGGSPLGQRLRGIVLDPEIKLSNWEETWLFLAARASHVDRVLRPALADGAIIISDRFSDSTLAYQGYGRGLDLTALIELNRQATRGLQPSLTLLLDLPAELGLARARGRGDCPDRIGDEELAFHRRVNAGFRRIAERNRDRTVVIDASRPLNEVLIDALQTANEWFDVGKRDRRMNREVRRNDL